MEPRREQLQLIGVQAPIPFGELVKRHVDLMRKSA
jgi:hypothetical protein